MPDARIGDPARRLAMASWNGPGWRVLVGITLVGAGLRCWQTNESLWLDELHTAWTASGSLNQVASRAAAGNQPPTFFYLAWLCVQLLGLNELAVRLPSLVVGTVLVPILGLAVFSWTKCRPAAWCAAGLAAVDHDFLFFAQEARPYAAVQLMGLLHVLVFWTRYRPDTGVRTAPETGTLFGTTRGRVLFVGSAVLCFYFHYTSAVLLLAELVCFTLWLADRSDRARAWLSFGLDLGCIAALCSPAASHLAGIAVRRADWALFVPRPLWFDGLWLFPLDVYFALPTGLVLLAWWWTRRRPEPVRLTRELRWRIILVGCWFLVPVLAALGLTTIDMARLFLRRYLIACAAAPMVCAGLAVALCRPRSFQPAMVLIVIAAATWKSGLVEQLVRDGRTVGDRTQDWRAAARTINDDLRGARFPVLVRSGLVEADGLIGSTDARLAEYCLLPVSGIYQIKSGAPGDAASSTRARVLIPLPNRDTGQLSDSAGRLIASERGCWLILNARPAEAERIVSTIVSSLTPIREETRKSCGSLLVVRLAVP